MATKPKIDTPISKGFWISDRALKMYEDAFYKYEGVIPIHIWKKIAKAQNSRRSSIALIGTKKKGVK